MTMTRKEFLGSIVGVGVVGAAALAGCGDDGGSVTIDSPKPPDGAAANCMMNGTTNVISGNHGHVLMVTAADINAGVEKTYNCQGTSLHAHMVTITVAQFTMLKANTSITVASTSDGTHTHNVTINCV